MFIIKLIAKIALLPVVLVLGILLGIVNMLTLIYGMFHGFVALFLGILCVATVLTFHDWVQAALLAVLCGCSFMILFASVFVETMLENGLGAICGFIAS